MTPQQIVALAVRLFSIWLCLTTLQMIAIGRAMLASVSNDAGYGVYAMAALIALVAILLWMFPLSVAHKLVPKTHHDNVLTMPARSAVAAGAVILGLWAVISTIPNVVATLALISSDDGSSIYRQLLASGRIAELFANLLRMGLGMFLIFKPWWIAAKTFPDQQTGSA